MLPLSGEGEEGDLGEEGRRGGRRTVNLRRDPKDYTKVTTTRQTLDRQAERLYQSDHHQADPRSANRKTIKVTITRQTLDRQAERLYK
jgi:hypothetical protein